MPELARSLNGDLESRHTEANVNDADDVSAGSHLPASAHEWIRTPVGEHIEVQFASGGTGVATALAGGARSVRHGELSGPSLGVTLEAWGPAGGPVRGQTAELVITRPMPSMPLHFWNDTGGSRHHDAYFPAYPGVRRHGRLPAHSPRRERRCRECPPRGEDPS
ncbi:hypothetical protein P1P75_21975 [Streptomyces sp. ID05-39B]|uniref:hypothetical protein n=1 Tax=Streptomyces sp. ID05-39B TaxID=3028664 RepID=UPI0029B5105E|nr:hypothetical protein [Streptomyces sp. ID05-39B]MDX3529024.1 hypothetical protein [Streptomyces sp. ID05-39B]